MSSRASQCLSAAAHHSFDKLAAGETYYGLRAQKTDRAEAANEAPRRQTKRAARWPELFQLFEEEPRGLRPEAFVELRPQERGSAARCGAPHRPRARCSHGADSRCTFAAEVDNLMDIFRLLDRPMAEQVVAVPKISCSSCPSRAVLREPQTGTCGGSADDSLFP